MGERGGVTMGEMLCLVHFPLPSLKSLGVEKSKRSQFACERWPRTGGGVCLA